MEKLVKILKKLFPYSILMVLVYFVPPVFILAQENEELLQRMLTGTLIILNPGISFFAGLLFGVKNGFHWYFVLMTTILFLLCLLLIYGFALSSFLLIYAVVVMVGLYLGKCFKDGMDEMYL